MSVTFDGLEPWLPGDAIIECRQTVIGDVDMHNYSDLDRVSLECGAVSTRLAMIMVDLCRECHFILSFEGVRELVIRQQNGIVQDPKLFEEIDLVIDPSMPGGPLPLLREPLKLRFVQMWSASDSLLELLLHARPTGAPGTTRTDHNARRGSRLAGGRKLHASC